MNIGHVALGNLARRSPRARSSQSDGNPHFHPAEQGGDPVDTVSLVDNIR
jgi:hypothetical protein